MGPAADPRAHRTPFLLKAETMKIQTNLRAGRKSADDANKDTSGKHKSDDPVTPPVSRCVGV